MVTESPSTAAAPELNVPHHVAIIMDGNGRWAQRRHLPRLAGHRAGVRTMHRIVMACADRGIETLTVYAFSTENWGRPRDEVNGLMAIFADASDRETKALHRNNVRVCHVGTMEGVNPSLRAAIERAVALTSRNTRITLNVAFNYGGRAEIVEAIKRIVVDAVPLAAIDEQLVSRYLYTAHMPDPDLMIRTAGEMRVSNFLIWQAAYSEYYSTPALWPDFGEQDLDDAIRAYQARHRKFGKL
jgi:undecaprenyl diphosphate synthase